MGTHRVETDKIGIGRLNLGRGESSGDGLLEVFVVEASHNVASGGQLGWVERGSKLRDGSHFGQDVNSTQGNFWGGTHGCDSVQLHSLSGTRCTA